jgi:hypothetical protein
MKPETGLPYKMGEQIGNVFETFPKRQNFHRENAQTIVQVEAEAALVDVVAQIAIRRGNDPYVDTPRGFVTDAFELVPLRNLENGSFGTVEIHADRFDQSILRAPFPCELILPCVRW